ncbi:hypothetical protein FDF08_09675 [Micrococcus luteus]|nr:hypothetical protein FDF08_09675 [Micrococcus luteus]
MSARRPRTYPAGSPERAVADAVAAVYAEADLKLEALQLDLLEPRPDGTRWTPQQVQARRITEALDALRDGFQEFGRGITAVAAAASKAVAALSAALTTTTRDDYTLAGPSKGAAS